MILDRLVLPMQHASLNTVVLVGLIVILISRLLYNKFGNGINRVPGPAFASYTDLWRLWLVWGRQPEKLFVTLHERYGPVVRLGPNFVSVAPAGAVQKIYALNGDFVKSDFSPVLQTIDREGRPLHSLFNTQDERFHARLRRAVANAYAMSTLVQFEPLVDSTSTVFLDVLQRKYADRLSEVCDFGEWIHFYAFDVIGEMTYSKRLGFVEQGVDVDHIIRDTEWLFDYSSVVGQLPILDQWILKNPIRLWAIRKGWINKASAVVKFAQKQITAHVKSAVTSPGDQGKQPLARDFLSRFREASAKDPTFFDAQRVLTMTVSNMFAGADSTAISLRAIFYLLLRNPCCMTKLVAELDAVADANPDDVLPRWNNVRDLPYLNCVVKEAVRHFPAVGLHLERIVMHEGGYHLPYNIPHRQKDTIEEGVLLPRGTIIGCNAWVVHRDESVFGDKPDEFRPERWSVQEGEDEEKERRRLSEMNSCLFSFGAGARSCVGKNISLLEMFKFVPAVLGRFELELAFPDEEWKTHNALFIKQTNFRVRLKTRERFRREYGCGDDGVTAA